MSRYDTYKPSGIDWIGEVPIDWKTLRIKNVASIINGSTPSSSVEEYWDGDIIWATPGDFNKFNKIIDDSESKITEAGYKTIKTLIAVILIAIGLVLLATMNSFYSITTLFLYTVIMIIGIIGGVSLLITTYPELTDLSEFDGDTISMLEDYEREIEELREHNLLLSDRYMTFKSIIKSTKIINEDNKEKYPHLYRLLYNEDLVSKRNKP